MGADKLLRKDQLGRQILTGLKIPNPDWDALPKPWRREALKNWWSEYEKKYRPQIAARTTLEKLRRQSIKKSPELLGAKNAEDFGKRVLSRLKIKDSVWDSLPKELKKQTTDWLEQEYEKSTSDSSKISPTENKAALEEAEKLVLDNRATETLKNFPDPQMAAGMLTAFRAVEDLSQKKLHYLSSEGLRAKATLYRQIIPKLQTTQNQLQSALDSLPDSPDKQEQQAALTQIMSNYEAQKHTYNEQFISPRKVLDQLGGVAQALQQIPPTPETENLNDLPAELTENHPFWKAPDWESAQKLYPHPVGVPTTESLPESVGQQWFGRHLKQQNWAENLADRPPLSSTEFERYLAQQFPAGKDFFSAKLKTELFGIYQLQLAEISAENPEAELSAAEKERADLQFIRELFPANLNLNERWMLEEWGGSLNPQSERQLTALAQNFRQLLHYYPQMNQWFEQDTSGNTALMISLLAKNYGRWFEFRLKALSVQKPNSPEAWVQSLFGEDATDKVTWEWVTHKNPKGWQRFQRWWSGKSAGTVETERAEISAENPETDLDSGLKAEIENADDSLEADQLVDTEVDSEGAGKEEKEKDETDKISAEDLEAQPPEDEGESVDETAAQSPAGMASEGKELSAEKWNSALQSAQQELLQRGEQLENQAQYLNALWQVAQRLTPELAQVNDGANIPTELNDWGAANWEAFQSQQAEFSAENSETDLDSESSTKEESAGDLEADQVVDAEVNSEEVDAHEQKKDKISVDDLEAEASAEGEAPDENGAQAPAETASEGKELSAENLKAEADLEASAEGEITDETAAQAPAETVTEGKELSAEKWSKALQAAQQELLQRGEQLEDQAQYLNALWQVSQRLTPELAQASDGANIPTELNDWGAANWEAFQSQQAEISAENPETDPNSESSAEEENAGDLEAEKAVDTEGDSEEGEDDLDQADLEKGEADELSAENLKAETDLEASAEGEITDETAAQAPAETVTEGKEFSAEKWSKALQAAQQELLEQPQQLENQGQYLNALWQVAQRLTPELAELANRTELPTELNDWGTANWEAFQTQQAEISAENSDLEAESEVSAAGEALDETAEQSPAEMASEGKELSAEKWNTALQSAQQQLLEGGEQLENQAQYLNALWQVTQRLTPELAQASDGADLPTELNDWGAANWEAFQTQQAEISAENPEADLNSESSAEEENADDLEADQAVDTEVDSEGDDELGKEEMDEVSAEDLEEEEDQAQEKQKEEKDRLIAAEKASLAAKEANQQQEKRAEEEQKQAEEKEQKEAQQKIPAPLRPLQFLAAGMPPEAMRSTASWSQGSTWSQLGGQLNQRPDWRAQLNKALHQSENMSDEAFAFFMTRFREIYVGQGSVTLDSFLSHWHAYLRWQQPSSPIVKNKLSNAYRSLVIHNVGGLFDYWARAHHQLQGTSIQSLTYQLTDDQGAQAIWFTKKGKQVFPLKIKQTEMP